MSTTDWSWLNASISLDDVNKPETATSDSEQEISAKTQALSISEYPTNSPELSDVNTKGSQSVEQQDPEHSLDHAVHSRDKSKEDSEPKTSELESTNKVDNVKGPRNLLDLLLIDGPSQKKETHAKENGIASTSTNSDVEPALSSSNMELVNQLDGLVLSKSSDVQIADEDARRQAVKELLLSFPDDKPSNSEVAPAIRSEQDFEGDDKHKLQKKVKRTHESSEVEKKRDKKRSKRRDSDPPLPRPREGTPRPKAGARDDRSSKSAETRPSTMRPRVSEDTKKKEKKDKKEKERETEKKERETEKKERETLRSPQSDKEKQRKKSNKSLEEREVKKKRKELRRDRALSSSDLSQSKRQLLFEQKGKPMPIGMQTRFSLAEDRRQLDALQRELELEEEELMRQERDLKMEEEEVDKELRKLGHLQKKSRGSLQLLNRSNSEGALRRDERRANIVKEIVVTEQHYVNALRIMVKNFVGPLYESHRGKDPIVPVEKIITIFGGVEKLLDYHERFYQAMKERQKVWDNKKTLFGDLFIKEADFLVLYSHYVNNYNYAIETLKKEQSTNSAFAKFISKCEQAPECKLKDLASFLIEPIQRIPRYQLLLRDLIKHTSSVHLDYGNLDKASQKIEGIAKYINEQKRGAENMAHVAALQRQLTGKSVDITKRKFVRDGQMLIDDGSGKNLVLCHVFLFQDVLLVCEEVKKKDTVKYKVHDQHNLSQVVISSDADNSVVRIMTEKKTLTLFAAKNDKNAWVEAFLPVLNSLIFGSSPELLEMKKLTNLNSKLTTYERTRVRAYTNAVTAVNLDPNETMERPLEKQQRRRTIRHANEAFQFE
eukprot:TRINITY_DN7755_c0_g1_i4.p1 TRINITY_DN7755_c0_g1~~TRINITY_DN7755_c0_g1_i4.p1  ORF type:complete len:832 (-),score=265.47 TRINITY_DN7755_c0_g1_i4:186-2681(-)